MITDPEGTAWFDSSGNEIADDCNGIYGNASGPSGAMYNQTINNAHYFTQLEFSNEDYKFNRAGSCEQHVDLPIASIKFKERRLKIGRAVTFSATASIGTISSDDWSFGDGSPDGSGVTVTHDYTAADSPRSS